jgi:XTP/dITP diphosphohydrolase
MTVLVLLDPALPTSLPVAALPHLTGPVYCTEEVPVKLMWNLPGARSVPADPRALEFDATVVTTDPGHPVATWLRTAGATVIAAARPTGLALLDTVELMDRLRREGAWEARQTHSSLLRYLVEETYEFADAVARLDAATSGAAGAGPGADAERQRLSAELCSELGDLLLQVIFHARIAQDAPIGAFDIDRVARTLSAKVRRRTPHLGGAPVDEATQAANWEAAKQAERAAPSASCLDGITLAQPALTLAMKVFERLRGAGFPTELVPAEVRTVTVDPAAEDAMPELDYRRDLLVFIERVRAAETELVSGRVESWAAAWDDARPGTGSTIPTVVP